MLYWEHLQPFVTPWTIYSPWNSPGQNTGVGSLSLLQRIFSAQGLNPGLPRCRQILYQLSHQGTPGRLEWVACPFSSGSSQPRNQIRVSCIAGGFFTNWAIREAIKVNSDQPPLSKRGIFLTASWYQGINLFIPNCLLRVYSVASIGQC